MRLQHQWIIGLAAVLSTAGCLPKPADSEDPSDLISVVAGTTDTHVQTPAAPVAGTTVDRGTAVSGRVGGSGDYKLISLGAALRGEEWTIVDDSGLAGRSSFLLVLLDENFDLLQRQIVSASTPLTHVVRNATETLYVGVAAAYGGNGGDYRFRVRQQADVSVPAPRRQVVWLNFAGGGDVSVHARTGLSFGSFEARTLGAAYADQTETVKAAIVAAMREDYEGYNVTILSSDDGPPPTTGPYATLHFGGYDGRLLGLADNVDQYNADRWQSAIVFVGSFADFAVMGLDAEGMGQMIGNVASHELGHLLGLFHTRLPEDIMDTTGTAWDLAGNQSFLRGPLEQSVFPVGYENSPWRLAETVGVRPVKDGDLAKNLNDPRMRLKRALRAVVRDEMRTRCGTCLHLDH